MEIDAALRAGAGLGALCKAHTGLAKASLSRHRSQCIGLVAAAQAPGGSSEGFQPDDAAEARPAAASVPAKGESSKSAKRLAKKPGGDMGDGSNHPPDLARARARATPLFQTVPWGVPEGVPGRSTDGHSIGVQPGFDLAAPPQPPAPAHAPKTDDEAVEQIADMMAAGEWRDRRSIKELSARWGLSRGKVRHLAGAAALACRADKERIEERREPSLGRWLKLYEEALILDPPDLKAAATALKGYDAAAGVALGTSKVEVNVALVQQVSNEYGGAVGKFIAAAAPELLDAFAAWSEAYVGGDAAAKADPAAWLEARRQVVETTAEEQGG